MSLLFIILKVAALLFAILRLAKGPAKKKQILSPQKSQFYVHQNGYVEYISNHIPRHQEH